MASQKLRTIMNFVISVLVTIVLVIFGLYFFSLTNDSFSTVQFFWLGVLFVLIGLFVTSASKTRPQISWALGTLFLGIGFYLFGRGSGVIRVAWLAYATGIACFAAAGIVLYLAWANRKAALVD